MAQMKPQEVERYVGCDSPLLMVDAAKVDLTRVQRLCGFSAFALGRRRGNNGEGKERQNGGWRRWVVRGGTISTLSFCSSTDVISSHLELMQWLRAAPPLRCRRPAGVSHLLDQVKINASGRSVHLGCPCINI